MQSYQSKSQSIFSSFIYQLYNIIRSFRSIFFFYPGIYDANRVHSIYLVIKKQNLKYGTHIPCTAEVCSFAVLGNIMWVFAIFTHFCAVFVRFCNLHFHRAMRILCLLGNLWTPFPPQIVCQLGHCKRSVDYRSRCEIDR